jgi:hypothetical protein
MRVATRKREIEDRRLIFVMLSETPMLFFCWCLTLCSYLNATFNVPELSPSCTWLFNNNNYLQLTSEKRSVSLSNNMTNVPEATSATATATSILSNGGTGMLQFVTGQSAATTPVDPLTWTNAGRPFASHREIYTRSLYRLCLKFTTSEDEDEGKPEPATAYWTVYGRTTTIGNAGPTSQTPDTICRRMDDSMTGPAAGVLTRCSDADDEQQPQQLATHRALAAAFTTGWQLRGDRGDAAVRVGKAKVYLIKDKNVKTEALGKEAQILSLDADRWALVKGASFAAGNSVFNVEDVHDAKQKLTVHCSKGPMRGKLIDIHASRCPYVFGRAHEADLCIMDRELSRRHGAILYLAPNTRSNQGKSRGKQAGFFCLVDLESTVRGAHA